MWMIAVLLILFSLSFPSSFCVKGVENESEEPYISVAVLRTVEKALLETGFYEDCKSPDFKVYISIPEYRERPIAYTPQQRISSYILSLKVNIRVNDVSKSFSASVPYSLPSGSLGDIPRRQAIEDIADKIFPALLDFFNNMIKNSK